MSRLLFCMYWTVPHIPGVNPTEWVIVLMDCWNPLAAVGWSFCICVHQGYWSVVLFLCWIFCWVGMNLMLTSQKDFGRIPSLLIVLSSLRRFGVELFKSLIETSIFSWSACWKVEYGSPLCCACGLRLPAVRCRESGAARAWCRCVDTECGRVPLGSFHDSVVPSVSRAARVSISVVSGVRMPASACFCFPLAWHVFFHPFFFSICVFLLESCFSCRQQIRGSLFPTSIS